MMNDNARAALWSVSKGPLTLLLYALSIFLIALACRAAGIVGEFNNLFSFGGGRERIATLVFAVALGFAAFLWWLCSRYFVLLRDAQAGGADVLATAKELPMALPEGTVRALIALIVGIVGLPMLVYSQELGLSDAISGYVNGIIIGVFSYYFGTRSSLADAQTARQTVKMLDDAQADKVKLEQQVGALDDTVQQTRSALEVSHKTVGELAATVQASGFGRELQRLQEQVAVADVLINVLGPALPGGLVPEGASEALQKARLTLKAASDVTAQGATVESVSSVAAAADALFGKSPLTGLLKTAAGVMPVLAGVPPAAGIALVLGVAWRLGADQYRRWVARVLNAPYDPQLISLGLITATSAEIALEHSPVFARAFAAERQAPGFFSELLDLVLRDDALALLWEKYGANAQRFASQGELEQGLCEFRGALLWDQSVNDITPSHIDDTLATLTGTPLAPTAPVASSNLDDVLRMLSQSPDATSEQRAAMEALIVFVGYMRQAKIDPAKLIAQASQS